MSWNHTSGYGGAIIADSRGRFRLHSFIYRCGIWLSYLKKVGKAPIVIAILEGVGAVLVVDLVLILSGHDVAFSLCLGAIAAATAPAATLMVVKQYKAEGPLTRTLLPVVAIDDAVALIGFGISVAIAKAIQDPSGQFAYL